MRAAWRTVRWARPREHGRGVGRRGPGRSARFIRHAPGRGNEHAGGGKGGAVLPRYYHAGLAPRTGAAPGSARSWPCTTVTAARRRGGQRPGVSQHRPRPGALTGTPTRRNALFANTGSQFRDLSTPTRPVRRAEYRPRPGGLDFDNDGAMDLLVTAIHGPAAAPQRLPQPRPLADGAGDRPTLKRRLRRGDRGLRRPAADRLGQPGSSYLCSNDPRVHFGLGKADRIDSIQVKWPDGTGESFPAARPAASSNCAGSGATH